MADDRVRIIVADDASEMRLLLKLGLRRSGKIEIVGEAGDGREAIDLVERHRPDVVLLDISMPVMDGLQAAREIKARYPATLIVMFSGFRAADLADRARDAGADRYIEKTADLSALEAGILEVMDENRAAGGSRVERDRAESRAFVARLLRRPLLQPL